MKISKKLILFSALFVLSLVTILSLLPPKSGVEIPTNDKVGHLLAYSALTFNFLLLTSSRVQISFLCLLLVLYGIVIEFIQGFIPGRDPSFFDILANTAGIVIATTVFLLLKKRIKQFINE